MISRAANRARLLAWSIFLLVATLWLHTRNNDFPYYYHTDEPGKVEQILGQRPLNFHHPFLMLGAARIAAAGAQSEQAVVQIGRWVSAAFTAAAIVGFSLMAYAWRGWIMGIAVGFTLMLHHQLFELSHYLKEDTALLFGVATTFLALHLFHRWPGRRTAALVGLGCGLAISGKYAGIIVLFAALPVVLARRPARFGPEEEDLLLDASRRYPRGRCPSSVLANIGCLLLAMVATVALINLPLLFSWKTAQESLARETQLVVEGQGLTQSVPHTKYWNVFLANTTPVMWVLILAALWGAWSRRRHLRLVEWITIGFPFFMAIVLSFSPKDNDRYFLPATALFTVLAAVGAGEIREFLPARFRRHAYATEIVAGLLLALAQLPSWTEDRGGLLRYWSAFVQDDTAEVTEWLRQNVPRDAIVIKDEKVRLPDVLRNSPNSPPLPFKLLSKDYAADFAPHGTVEELLAQKISYVVITDSTFGKFERSDLKPKGKEAADYERRKQFYAELRRDTVPLIDRRRGTVIYLHPGLEVYHITP